jgi:hypothetical protein
MHRALLLAMLVSAPHLVAHAQSEAGARAFVQGLYDRYGRDDPEYLGRDAPAAFSPSLLRLFHRVQAATPEGSAMTPDWDPICDCQDPDGLKLVGLSIHPASAASATADVLLDYSGQRRIRIEFKLARQGQVWRVSDVEEDGTDLRDILHRALR